MAAMSLSPDLGACRSEGQLGPALRTSVQTAANGGLEPEVTLSRGAVNVCSATGTPFTDFFRVRDYARKG